MFINIHTHNANGESCEVVNHNFSMNNQGFFSIGVHPWDSSSSQRVSLIQNMEKLATHQHCLAIGEIGLDRLKGAPLDKQIDLFKQQIILSEKLQLPVVIHCVKAWNEIASIKSKLNPKQTWIFHGFNKVSLLNAVLKNKLMISIGADVLSSKNLQEAVKFIPLSSLFLETDESSESILSIYKRVSALKNIPLQALENQIETNFKRVFTKWITGLNVQNY